VIFWPREKATLLKSNLRYFHREKSTFEKFDASLKLRIVFYTHKTIKNRRKNFRVIYTLSGYFYVSLNLVAGSLNLNFAKFRDTAPLTETFRNNHYSAGSSRNSFGSEFTVNIGG